jgi:protein-disulfide isomerase
MSALTYSLDTPRLTVPVNNRDHVQGPATATVTLLEYGDYECPFCAAAAPAIKQVQQQVGDLLFAYRHFPLTQIHPHAFQAAEAAEAAGAQGSFWEIHDLLFTHQDALELQDLFVYARALGLDLERFATDLASNTHAGRVREDFMSGIRSGVNGTPTFFNNDVRYNGGYDVQSLLAGLSAAV